MQRPYIHSRKEADISQLGKGITTIVTWMRRRSRKLDQENSPLLKREGEKSKSRDAINRVFTYKS